jgi:uncharacterized membrane protein
MWIIGLLAGLLLGAIVFGFPGAIIGGFFGWLAGFLISSKSKASAATPPSYSDRLSMLEQRLATFEQRMGAFERQGVSPSASAEPASVEMGVVHAAGTVESSTQVEPEPALTTAATTTISAHALADQAVPEPEMQEKTSEVMPEVASSQPRAPATPNPLVAWFTGGNTIVRIGIVILFIGVAFLVKYAADHALFPLEIRLASAAAGAIVMLML